MTKLVNLKNFLKCLLPMNIQHKFRNRHEYLRIACIKKALRHQGLLGLYNKLCSMVPDISDQYTDNSHTNSEYFMIKIRGMHAFQVSLMQKALRLLGLEHRAPFNIVDIGDSSGTHLNYIKQLYKNDKINTLSVNLDPEAVRRIREKGMEAVCIRAEDLDAYPLKGDIYLSFETLEHLFDPTGFLYKLSRKAECKALVITVPYIRQSRVGLQHIRNQERRDISAESVHVFELSPDDWKLIFQHAGWSVVYERTYLQYPRKGLLGLMRRYWKKIDYEGFYGVILARDPSWSDSYRDWKL